MKQKLTFNSFLAATYLLTSLAIPAHAQLGVRPGGAQNLNVTQMPAMIAQPGVYEMNNTQAGPVLTNIFNASKDIQDKDRAYIITAKDEAIASHARLVALLVKFEKMSDDSRVAGSGVEAVNYLPLVREINAAIESEDMRIKALATVANSMPSAMELTVAGANQRAVKNFDINMKPLVDLFTEKLNAVKQRANSLKFVVTVKEKNVMREVNGNALTAELKVPLLTKEKRDELRDLIKRLTSIPALDQSGVRMNLLQVLKRDIADFMTNYGSSERFRFRGDEKEDTPDIKAYYGARARIYKTIVQHFWIRSYLRNTFGVQLGTFMPVDYDKQFANVDVFTATNAVMTRWKAGLALESGDIQNAFENMRNWMNVYDKRSQKLLEGWDFKKNGILATVLAKANSFATFIQGRRPNAEVNAMVANLIFADILEELNLTTPDGRAANLDFYVERYKATQADKDYYNRLMCQFDTTNAAGCEGMMIGNGAAAGAGIVRYEQEALTILSDAQADLDRAREYQELIAADALSNGKLSQQNSAIRNRMKD